MQEWRQIWACWPWPVPLAQKWTGLGTRLKGERLGCNPNQRHPMSRRSRQGLLPDALSRPLSRCRPSAPNVAVALGPLREASPPPVGAAGERRAPPCPSLLPSAASRRCRARPCPHLPLLLCSHLCLPPCVPALPAAGRRP